ncbi:hypothetical protein PIB30_010073 [Stylosanthes scabra]|uniref:PB1-like domain-containing protein n=1 Tax=Stylosanthes scabra TaxID=79078 RepID=A0ABU6X6W1_9FABA|nr:hypothetical protein [Stylosanthes scabra]
MNCHRQSLEVEMAPIITLIYHHMGRLEKDPNGLVKYSDVVVTNIGGVNTDACNMLSIEGLILDLGYASTEAIYWFKVKQMKMELR